MSTARGFLHFRCRVRRAEQPRRTIPSNPDSARELRFVAGQGRAVVDLGAFDQLAQRVSFTRSELEELQLICHRIAVMRRGAIAGILSHRDATKERIMTAAAGTHASTAQLLRDGAER